MIKRCYVAAVLLLAVAVAGAADLGAIKERMRERLPTVSELKQQQLVGITNRGYLQVLPEDVDAETRRLVAAENADRKLVYQAIATRTGASVETVEKLRAKQLAQQARPGIMLEDAEGKWFVKAGK